MKTFFILYILMCILWTIFCLRAQHAVYGTIRYKDILVLIVNFIFAPISMIVGIKRIPKDIQKRK